MRRVWTDRAWAVGGALLLVLLWEVLVRALAVPHFILPAPSGIARALVERWEALFLIHLPATLAEVALGLLLSVAGGVLLAVAMVASRWVERLVYPLVVVSQTIPIIALSPVFILWFGYSVWTKVAVTVLVTFFPIVVNTYDGLTRTPAALVDLLRTMGATRRQIFWKAQVPAALPAFFSGLKVAVVFSVIGATVGEWLGAEAGLGYFARRASHNLRAEELFAAVVVLSLLGIALFALTAFVERRLLNWHRAATGNTDGRP